MFLHRYGHARLAWLLTSCAFRARTRMKHSQYQHGRGSSLTKRVFLLCWFCFMPTRQMDFVRSSFVVLTCPMGLGPCVGCSTYVLIQPHLSIFNNHSRDVAYQPLVRCVGFAVNTHSVADSLQRRFDCLARPSANPNLFSDNPIRRSDNPALFSDTTKNEYGKISC